MRTLGIDIHEDLYYEGDNTNGRAIWPAPVVMVATLLTAPFEETAVDESTDLGLAKLVFREDTFDPMARIRRGRFYSRSLGSGQPQQWRVHPHPALPGEVSGAHVNARFAKLLHGFGAWPATQNLRTEGSAPMIALGPRPAFTLWRVLHVERAVTGEDLVTLKARSTMGLLPQLDENAIPSADFARTRRVLGDLADAVHSSGPGSIVDRARDAAQWCIGVWSASRAGDSKLKTVDLQGLLRKLPPDQTVPNALGHVIARLHSRVKPNEQERYAVRPVTEDDAEYAVSAVGMLLRELGWAT